MSRYQAISLMILAASLWSIAGVVTRHLDSAPCFEVTFWRSGFCALALAIGVAGMGIIWMFVYDKNATFSITGSLVSLGVPLAAAINFTLLQHIGLDKVPVTDRKPAQDMTQAVLIGAILSALATLPLAWPLQASVHDIDLLSVLGIFQLAIPGLLVVRLSRDLSAPEISLLGQLEVIFGVTWDGYGQERHSRQIP